MEIFIGDEILKGSRKNENYKLVPMPDRRERLDSHLLVQLLGSAGVDLPFLLQETFLRYKERKRKDKRYEKDGEWATQLIRTYYSLKPTDADFNKMKRSFVQKYVRNESKLEDIHEKNEIAGLRVMYNYLHSQEFEDDFSIYSLNELNKKLFTYAPFPEYAGVYRSEPRYLPGTGLDLCDYSMVRREMYALSPEVDALHDLAKEVRKFGDVEDLLSFLDWCVELKVKLIWIHPFPDGNGRTVRAFINRLLEDAGLPPIYVKASERTEYHTAMNQAIGDGDLTAIKAFYRYKVCDSIVELDIEDRIKNQGKQSSQSGTQKVKKANN